MALKLYNTLTRTKDEFRPLDPKNVRMYVCGPTVYDFAHIGNARPVIVFDVLFRLLEHLAKQGVWDGGKGETKVTYVRNITDVDDKINARAAEEGVSIRDVTERTAKQYFEDVAALGALPPTHQPRATEYIANMIAMIERLIAAGNAYPAEGHVLYDVSSKPDYGKLSRRSLDEMIAGARVEIAPYKKNPMDFVLWKPSKPGEPSWPSPWSNGRPGWHIECSAMSEALLGETFDIHGGGIDLVFPHHENEIAQSESAHAGHPFAHTWMHNGFLQVEGEKMSKSLGNFITIRELLTGWRGQPWRGAAIRLAMLGSHYRQPIDWTFDRLSEAQAELDRFFKVWKNMIGHPNHTASIRAIPSEKLVDALSDDLNVPDALAEIRTRRAEIFGGGERGPDVYQKSQSLISDLFFLGVLDEHTLNTLDDGYLKNLSSLPAAADDIKKLKDFPVYVANNDVQSQQSATATLTLSGFKIAASASGVVDVVYAGASSETVQQLIEKRNAARAMRDFKESDRIRDELAAKGIALKDSPTGTTWEVKR